MISTARNKGDMLTNLIRVLGEGNATAEECDLVCYEKDYSLNSTSIQFLPDFVVQPETTKQVSEVIKLANIHKIPVVPRGGGTGVCGGTIPSNGGIVLDMRKMDRIVYLDEEKRTVTAQSGVLVRNLANYLEKRGFFVADKPESWFAATIGARTQANGVGNNYNLRYGQSIDQIICLEVVLPNGEIIKTGPSKVNDPVSGYDLTKLFSNAEGTLGIITEVTLRIYRLPEHKVAKIIIFSSFKDAIEAVMAIRDSGLVPETIWTTDESDYKSYSENALHVEKALTERRIKNAGVMVIGYAGINRLIQVHIELTLEICNRFGGKMTPDEQTETWMKTKETYPVNPFPIQTALKKKPVKYILDATVPLESTADLVEVYHNLVNKYGIESHGIAAVHCAPDFHSIVCAKAYVDERNQDEIETIRKMEGEIYHYVKSIGGGIGGSGGVGLSKLYYMKDQDKSALDLMKKLKLSIDPNNVINPGKKFKAV
jgi:glycolate oxidase